MPSASLAPLAACIRIAANQHGLITRSQLIEAGASPASLRRLVGPEGWSPALPKVYSLWTPATRMDVWLQRLKGGALWLGEGSWVSHRSGALLWGFDGVRSAPVEFLSLRDRRVRGVEEPIIHRTGSLSAEDVASHRGFEVTSAARTMVDIASLVTPQVLELAFEYVLRTNLATKEQIIAAMERAGPTRSGRRELRALLNESSSEATASALETILWQVCRALGIAPPVRQYVIRNERGIPIARTDFAFPYLLIAIEADGYESHSRKRDWQADRTKQNELTRRGWAVYRFTWEDVTRRRNALVQMLTDLLTQPPAQSLR